MSQRAIDEHIGVHPNHPRTLSARVVRGPGRPRHCRRRYFKGIVPLHVRDDFFRRRWHEVADVRQALNIFVNSIGSVQYEKAVNLAVGLKAFADANSVPVMVDGVNEGAMVYGRSRP